MRERVLTLGPPIRRSILMGLVIGVPLVFARFTDSPFNVPKLALLMIGVSLVASVRAIELLQKAPARGLLRLALPAAAISLPLFAAWAVSPYPAWSLFGNHGRFQGLVPYIVILVFGILVADAFHGRARDLALALLVAGGVVGAYVVVQVVGLDPFRWIAYREVTQAGVGTLGNPNFAGGFLGMTLPVGLVLWVFDPARRSLIWKLALFNAAGWILTFSQGGWAAGLAGASVAAGIVLRSRWDRAPLAGAVAAGLLTFVTVGIVVVGIVDPENRFVPSTVRVRGGWWVAAARMGADHPVLGRGPNSFAVDGVEFRTAADAIEHTFESADDPHSVPLSLFAAAGIPGLVGFTFLLLWALRVATKEPNRDPLMVAFLGVVVAYFVQSLVSIDEVALRVGLWTGLAGIACCVGVEPTTRTKNNQKKGQKKRRANPRGTGGSPLRAPAAVAGVALLGIAGAWWGTGFLIAGARVHQGSTLLRQGNLEEGRTEFERALGFRDEFLYRRLYSVRLLEAIGNSDDPPAWLLPTAKDAYSYLDGYPEARALAGTARLLRDLAELDPSIETESIELYDEALGFYTRAIRRDPLNPDLRTEAAAVLADLKRFDEAANLLRATPRSVLERVPSIWGLLALYEARAGDDEAARSFLELALAADPSDPNAATAKAILGRP